MTFTKAERKKSKLRLALIGASGSGKTYTSLHIARGLVGAEGKIAVIDTEHGSASLYADICDFDVCELDSYQVQSYIRSIHEAERASYDCVVIDSLSHAWSGSGGILELVNAASEKTHNTFTAWKEATPLQNELIDTIIASPCHIIATMRSKTEYVLEQNDKGKSVPRKVGLAPVQRDSIEYEFSIVGYMNESNSLSIEKTRIVDLSQSVIRKPGIEFGEKLRAWLEQGIDDVSYSTKKIRLKAILQEKGVDVLKVDWSKITEENIDKVTEDWKNK